MTPEERERLLRLSGGTPSKLPSPTTPTLTTSKPGREARASTKLTGEEISVEKAEDALRKELFAKFQAKMGPATKEAVLARVDEEMASRTQPPSIGGFGGAVIPPWTFTPSPTKFEEEAPLPVGEELTVMDVLRPKVRAPSLSKENPFNDLEFEKSLKGLTEGDKREKRSTYAGFKAAYSKLRELNPGSSTEEIVKDIQRQLRELPSRLEGGGEVISQDPRLELGIANDPTALALSRQTKPGVVPKLEPGQLAFMKGIYESELPIQISEDKQTLRKEGRVITRKELRPTGEIVGGRPVREEVEVPTGERVPYTQEEIDAIVSRRKSEGKYDARPWWMNEEERKKVLADPEKYAEGGLLFEKKYATGATVESPVAWTVRAAMSPINAAAGFIGYGFTPEDIQKQKAAGRPEKYKGEGVKANVLYNVAESGGFTQEIGDLYKYHPDPSVRRYETLGKVAGFAADLLSLGDIAVAAGVGGGVKAGVQTARAARLAGEAKPIVEGLRAGMKGAAASYVDALPGLGRFAEKLQPGDVRFIYGSKLADDFKAASVYKQEFDRVYNELVKAGDVLDDAVTSNARFVAHDEALRIMGREFEGTKFIDDAERNGARIRDLLDKDYFTEAQRAFRSSDDVSRLADKLARGEAIEAGEELLLKPYLSAAAKADPEIARGISDAFKGAEAGKKVTASDIFKALPNDLSRAIYADAIKTSAAFEAGVKILDTQLAGMWAKGAPTVMLTPRTIATPESAKVITDRYLESNFYKNVTAPLQDLSRVDVESAGKVIRGFNLADPANPNAVPRLRKLVDEAHLAGKITDGDATRVLSNLDNLPRRLQLVENARLTGNITEEEARSKSLELALEVMSVDDLRALNLASPDVVSRLKVGVQEALASGGLGGEDAARILGDIEKGVLSANDLRSIVYTQVDDLALLGRGGFTERAVAQRKGLPSEVARGQRVSQIKGERSTVRRGFVEALEKTLPVKIKQVTKSLTTWESPLEKLVTPVQAQIIKEAKGKVGALNYTLRDEFRRVNSDPEFAALYGVTTDASVDEKLIALGRGAMKTPSLRVGETYATSLLDSIFYGTSKSPLKTAFSGEYQYGKTVLSNVREYERLLTEIAELSPGELANRLDDIYRYARELVETNFNRKLTEAGGRVLSVPKVLNPEVLSVAYARTKTGEFIADAALKVLPERPLSLSAPMRSTIGSLNGAGLSSVTGGDKFFYELVKDEIIEPGGLQRMIVFSEGKDFGELRKYLFEVLKKTNPGVDPKQGSTLIYDWLLETGKSGNLNLYDMTKDLEAQVDLMRSAGLIHDNNPDEAIYRLGALMSGEISPDNLVLPALAEKMRADIGTEPKYKAMLRELARLSDEAEDGSLSAAGAVRYIRWLMDSYTAFFYYNTLSLAPRFHGVNNLTAPLITYYTTGRLSNPLQFVEGSNVLLLGSPLSNPSSRLIHVVTDKFGNSYTRGDLYDLAVKNGVFKSQINTEVAGSFIDEANAIIGNTSIWGKGKKFFTLPREFLGDPLAAFTDNAWRMESVTAALRDGKTIEEALDYGRRSLFDYGDLTEFERKYASNLFLFYNYFRQSIVTAVRNTVENPSRMIRMVRATEQPSKIMVGDQNARDLSFYFPSEWGVARILKEMEPGVGKKEGRAVALPMMPHADALNIFGTILTNPMAFLAGSMTEEEEFREKFKGEGERRYGEGFVASKLRPLTAVAGAYTYSPRSITDPLDVKLTKNRIPPEHMAIIEALPDALRLPLEKKIFDIFDIERKPAAPGEENSLNGEVFVTSEEGFQDYKLFSNFLELTGTRRTLTDYGKIVGGEDLQGTYPKTGGERALSAIGAATYMGATAEEITRRRALESRAKVLEGEAAILEKKRLPKRESNR